MTSLDAYKVQQIEDVIHVLKLSAVLQPIPSEKKLYERIKASWNAIHSVPMGELQEEEKEFAFQKFYEIPNSLQERYFSKNMMPPEHDLKQLFNDWAWTGLSFNENIDDDRVLPTNINDFLSKRCNVQVRNSHQDIMWLSRVWKNSKMETDRKLQKERKKLSPSKRARLDNVPWCRPMMTIRTSKPTFVEIPYAENGIYSTTYFEGMFEVLNEMNEKFPNLRNSDIHNHHYRPATSHLWWTLKTAALLAYHLSAGDGDKPLSQTIMKFGNTEKWEYKTDDQHLHDKMTEIFLRFFRYGTGGIFERVKTTVINAESHFTNCKALGQFLTNWRKKADIGGNYYVTLAGCDKQPSEAVMTEHFLFFDACGMWTPYTSED